MSNGNGHRWSKFWWRDHQGDAALRMCSLAARGLWIELLCLAHEATPVGHVLVNGKQPTPAQIAAIAGASLKETHKLLTELESAGVFSRTADGVIFSRRMVKDAAVSELGRESVSKRYQGHNPDDPTRGPSRHPTSKPNGDATGEPYSNAFRPLSRGPTTLEAEADSDLEAEEGRKEESSPSLPFPCPAREDQEPPIAAQLAVGNILGRLTRSLSSSATHAQAKPPLRSVAQQQLAAVSSAQPSEHEEAEPAGYPRRGPVDPIRTVAEQIAWLQEHAA